MQLHEAVAEGAREHLAPAIRPGRVLRRKEHEVGVGADNLSRFGQEQLAVIVEQAVERLEHLKGGGVAVVVEERMDERRAGLGGGV